MKNTISVSVIAIFLIALAELKGVGQGSPHTVVAQNQANDKTIKLFNGNNLDGWYTFLQNRGRNNDPKHVFTVRDGMIRISGEEWGVHHHTC